MIKIDKIIRKYGLVLVTLLIFGCQTENKSTNLYSYQIDDKTEKIETLKKYVTKESGLIDAEYHIWFQDNGKGRFPGPSDYTIKVALKVEPDSLDSWANALEPS